MPPQIESITPPEGKPLDEVSIKGKFFGTKKGKVLLEYVVKGKTKTKSCKITDWYMNPETGESEIIFLVAKGLDPGNYPLTIVNSVGEATGDFKIVLP
jgi:hypothetical protein